MTYSTVKNNKPRKMYDYGKQYDVYAQWLKDNNLTPEDTPIQATTELGFQVTIEAYFDFELSDDIIYGVTYDHRKQTYLSDYTLMEYDIK